LSITKDLKKVGITKGDVRSAMVVMNTLGDKFNDLLMRVEEGDGDPTYQNLYEDLCGECYNVLVSLRQLRENY